MDPNNLQSALNQFHHDITPSSYVASAFSFSAPTHNVNSITTFPFEHTPCCNQPNSILQENEINLFHIKESVNDYFGPFDFSELPDHPPTSHISPTIPLFVNEGSEDQSNHHHQQQQQQKRNQPHREKKQEYQSLDTLNDTRTCSETRNQAMKRNKETRRIYQVPFVEKIATRSWRKYGKKPIKGSPYPRGYYRCNLAKGCLARKQVDQKRSDPNVLIITYIGEHNHPLPPPPCGERKNNQKTKIDESKDVVDDNVLDEVIDDGTFEGLDEIVDLT